MRENTPIRRSKPLPSVYPAISADGFIPVDSRFCNESRESSCNHFQNCSEGFNFSANACDCNSDCGCNTSRRENDCGCDCSSDCGCNTSRRDTDCGCDCNSDCGCNTSRRDTDCGCDCSSDCGCNTSRRDNDCGCDCNSDCGCNTSRRDIDCGCDCISDCGCNNCQNAGMVYGVTHSPHNRMKCEDAIRHGTLFRELHKPFAAQPCPSGCNEPSCKQELAFAAWELRLYLNTHPNDRAALKLFEEYESKLRDANYATTFVPGSNGRRHWTWLDDPWPWENCNGKERS